MVTQGALNLMVPDGPFPSEWFMRFGCVYADPNWSIKMWGPHGYNKAPQDHYACDDTDTIAALPVESICARDCWLVMWATFPMLPDALRVLGAWGFTYVTGGSWAKESKTGAAINMGSGYVRRSASELYLIGKRGDPPLKPGARSIRNLIWAPIREHSRKPDQMYDEIEASFEGPYVELFAVDQIKAPRPGWDAWGRPHR